MKQAYEISVTVMAESRDDALNSIRIENEVRRTLRVTPVECEHQWWAHRTVVYEERAPAVVNREWLDIPNGLDGDYAIVAVVNPWKDDNLVEWDQWTEKVYSELTAHCILCGATIEDGEKVS